MCQNFNLKTPSGSDAISGVLPRIAVQKYLVFHLCGGWRKTASAYLTLTLFYFHFNSLALSSLNKHTEAVVYYKKALELDPDNDTYKSNLKIAEQKMKETPSPVSSETNTCYMWVRLGGFFTVSANRCCVAEP